MSHPSSSFIAPPGKRHFAFLVDLLSATFIFLLVNAIAEGLNIDLARFDIFACTYVCYQGAMLTLNAGQTFGRYLVNISVYSADGIPISKTQAFLRSIVRVALVAMLQSPQPLCMFSFFSLVVLILVEIVLMYKSSTRQTIADIVAKTLTVNLPPPHSHHTPVGPIFSASDAEFGHQPRWPKRRKP